MDGFDNRGKRKWLINRPLRFPPLVWSNCSKPIAFQKRLASKSSPHFKMIATALSLLAWLAMWQMSFV